MSSKGVKPPVIAVEEGTHFFHLSTDIFLYPLLTKLHIY